MNGASNSHRGDFWRNHSTGQLHPDDNAAAGDDEDDDGEVSYRWCQRKPQSEIPTSWLPLPGGLLGWP